MRKPYYVLALLCTLAASAAQAAGGVCMRWNACFSEAGAAANLNFACDTDAGNRMLVGSFYLPSNVTQATRISAVIDMAASAASMPAWWQFNNCRSGSLAVNGVNLPTNLACEDWSAGLATASLTSFSVGGRGPNTARITLTSTVPGAADAQDLFAFVDYFAFNVAMNNLNTVSGSACAGCATPVCVVLNQVSVLHSGPAPLVMTSPANNTDSHYVTWQGGGAPVVGAVTGCPAATPTRVTTWGAVKGLYR